MSRWSDPEEWRRLFEFEAFAAGPRAALEGD